MLIFSNFELYLVLTYTALLVLKINQTFKWICNWRWWLNDRNMSCFQLKVVHFLKNYLNNRVFLSRNYWLIVALQTFDVLKTNICSRSKPSRANLLVLKTSNFWGAFMRLIVPRHKHSIVFSIHVYIYSTVPWKHARCWRSDGVNKENSHYFW